jgi:hypothetical protein
MPPWKEGQRHRCPTGHVPRAIDRPHGVRQHPELKNPSDQHIRESGDREPRWTGTGASKRVTGGGRHNHALPGVLSTIDVVAVAADVRADGHDSTGAWLPPRFPDNGNPTRRIVKRPRASGHERVATVARKANGVARGGPCDPTTSPCRHVAREAADIRWWWRPFGEGPFRTTGGESQHIFLGVMHDLAHEAGLCGPPASDPVHVQLKYKLHREAQASCHGFD